MSNRTMLLFDILAILGILALAINVIAATLIATLAGSDTILVHLNRFGEQLFEAITFPVAGLLGIAAFIRAIRRYKNNDSR